MPLYIAQEFDPFRKQVIPDPFGRSQTLELGENQVPVWLSFLPRRPGASTCRDQQPPPDAIFFGAAFDSGNSYNLSVGRRHFGLTEDQHDQFVDAKHPLKAARAMSGQICSVARLLGDLWIFSNFLKTDDGGPLAYNLRLGVQGVSSYGNAGPRIPMLGVHAFAHRQIDCLIQFSRWPTSRDRKAMTLFFVP